MPDNVAAFPEDRIAFCIKGSYIGAFWLIRKKGLNAVVNFDPRRSPHPFHYWSYETPLEAEQRFNEFLAQTRDNGWLIAYTCRRNNAALS
jgi:hypothetical protein